MRPRSPAAAPPSVARRTHMDWRDTRSFAIPCSLHQAPEVTFPTTPADAPAVLPLTPARGRSPPPGPRMSSHRGDGQGPPTAPLPVPTQDAAVPGPPTRDGAAWLRAPIEASGRGAARIGDPLRDDRCQRSRVEAPPRPAGPGARRRCLSAAAEALGLQALRRRSPEGGLESFGKDRGGIHGEYGRTPNPECPSGSREGAKVAGEANRGRRDPVREDLDELARRDMISVFRTGGGT